MTEDAPLLVESSCGRRPTAEAALELELGQLQSQLNGLEGGNRPISTKTQHKRPKALRSESGASTAVSYTRSVKLTEKISVAAVVVHLLKGNIGPGAMSLPNGFSKSGIYAGPVLFVIVVSQLQVKV